MVRILKGEAIRGNGVSFFIQSVYIYSYILFLQVKDFSVMILYHLF